MQLRQLAATALLASVRCSRRHLRPPSPIGRRAVVRVNVDELHLGQVARTRQTVTYGCVCGRASAGWRVASFTAVRSCRMSRDAARAYAALVRASRRLAPGRRLAGFALDPRRNAERRSRADRRHGRRAARSTTLLVALWPLALVRLRLAGDPGVARIVGDALDRRAARSRTECSSADAVGQRPDLWRYLPHLPFEWLGLALPVAGWRLLAVASRRPATHLAGVAGVTLAVARCCGRRRDVGGAAVTCRSCRISNRTRGSPRRRVRRRCVHETWPPRTPGGHGSVSCLAPNGATRAGSRASRSLRSGDPCRG